MAGYSRLTVEASRSCLWEDIIFDDKQCIMEARPAGMQPVAVTHAAATVEQAVDGAAQKLNRLLDSTFGRLNDRKKGGGSFAGEQDD